jgi:uncharacterized protein YgiM (DUF1202 family)
MKLNFGLFLGIMISTGLLAQQVTNAPIAAPMESAPAPATTAPAKPVAKKSAAKKPAPKKPATELKTTPLVPGPAVVSANHVNVRTRAGLNGEVVYRLTNGEPVTVIEEIKLKRSGPEEPSAWAKIALPGEAKAWVKSSFLDSTGKAVAAKKLNVRGGPGEDYGVLGTLQKGDAITEFETKGEWTRIAPPPGTTAFVAAQYLTQEPSAIASATPPTAAPVTEAPTVAPTTTEVPPPTQPTNSAEIISNELATAMSSKITLAPPPEELPPPPRIVQREGLVRGTTSIQSPTKYELISPDDRRLINYLYTTTTNLDLSRYKGLHIIVTGEEGLDERWKFTPVITIQKIQVLE